MADNVVFLDGSEHSQGGDISLDNQGIWESLHRKVTSLWTKGVPLSLPGQLAPGERSKRAAVIGGRDVVARSEAQISEKELGILRSIILSMYMGGPEGFTYFSPKVDHHVGYPDHTNRCRPENLEGLTTIIKEEFGDRGDVMAGLVTQIVQAASRERSPA